jgi:hypothetical protein
MSAGGVTNGAMMGLFSFGMFYPRGNTKVGSHYLRLYDQQLSKYLLRLKVNYCFQGALAGSICSLVLMGWIVFGTQKAMADGKIKHPTLPVSVQGCSSNITLPDLQT